MSHKFDFDFVPYTRDSIAEMSSDDLHKQISKVRRLIREARLSGRNTEPYEVEFCYLDHERQMRQRYERPKPVAPRAPRSFRGGNK